MKLVQIMVLGPKLALSLATSRGLNGNFEGETTLAVVGVFRLTSGYLY